MDNCNDTTTTARLVNHNSDFKLIEKPGDGQGGDMFASPREGCVDAGVIPEPQRIDGTVAVMYWRGGKIEYEYEPVPTVQEIEARMRAEEALLP